MLKRIDARDIQSTLQPMSRRPGGPGVYFVRVHVQSPAILNDLWKYHEAARSRGVIIEGQIANPEESHIRYLNDVLGGDFKP